MRRILTLSALALLILGCNSKSPEKTDDGKIDPVSLEADSKGQKPEQAKEKKKEKLPLASTPNFVAFDFLNNRPLSQDVYKNTFFVDAASNDFVKYIHGNHQKHWKLGLEVEGEKGAAMQKTRTSTLWMPGQKGAKTLTFKLLNTNPNPNTLSVTLNGKKLEPAKLKKGWQIVSFDTKGAALDENTIALSFAGLGRINGVLSGGALQWIALGQEKEKHLTFTGGQQGRVELLANHQLVWHVWALDNSFIRVDFESDTQCPIKIELRNEAGKKVTSTFTPLKENGKRQQASFDVKELGESVVRVTAGSVGECNLLLHEMAMGIPGKQPVLPKANPPKYVLFWMIDTLRSDMLPIHFKTDVIAPELQKLAKEGASFELAYVQGNESKTSHASVFTSLYPNRHKVIGKGKVASKFEIMPEAIKKLGYKTGANIANGYISKPWGFVQGWNMYLNNLREGHTINGQKMAKKAAKWMIQNKEKKHFMYVGTIDPHVTYHRHNDLIEKYYPDKYSGRFDRACSGQDLGLIKGKKLKVSDKDKKRIEALYKNEVTYADGAFGIIRKELEDAGMWKDTMVVVTSDHGDEFWEHGKVGHGHSVYEQLVHVPLIIYYPPLIPKNTVLTSGADSIDIYPTIIDMLGGQRPKNLQGQSLLPTIHGLSGAYPNPAISTSYLRDYGLQIRQWKLYLKHGKFRVYDRENDPQELTNVANDHPLATRMLLNSVGWFRFRRAKWDKQKHGSASNLKAGFFN